MKNASRKTAATVLTLIGIAVFTCCACSKSDDDSPSVPLIRASIPRLILLQMKIPGP